MTKFDKERQQLAIAYWKRVCEGANHYHTEPSRPDKNANAIQIDLSATCGTMKLNNDIV